MATTSVAKTVFFQNLSVVLLCASALALLYFLLSKSCGQWVAVLLAAVAATNPGLVYYSRIITHVPFLFVGSVWFLRSAVGFHLEKRPRFLLLLWVSAVVTFLAHFGGLALILVAGGLTILNRKSLRPRYLFMALFLCLLVAAPFLSYQFANHFQELRGISREAGLLAHAGNILERPLPAAGLLFKSVLANFNPADFAKAWDLRENKLPGSMVLVGYTLQAFMVAGLGVLLVRLRRSEPNERRRPLLLLAFLVVPIGIQVFTGQDPVARPDFSYLYFPAQILVLGGLFEVVSERPLAGEVSVVILLIVVGVQATYCVRGIHSLESHPGPDTSTSGIFDF